MPEFRIGDDKGDTDFHPTLIPLTDVSNDAFRFVSSDLIGIQRTMNWMANTYTSPTTFAAYDLTKYPVQATANSNAVVLSALSGTSSNYPTSSVQTAYNTALSNQSIPGIPNATFQLPPRCSA